MPLFKCTQCGCVENTALGNYWGTYKDEYASATCSECHTGTWHGQFPKQFADPDVWHPELPHNPQFLRREPYDPEKHGQFSKQFVGTQIGRAYTLPDKPEPRGAMSGGAKVCNGGFAPKSNM